MGIMHPVFLRIRLSDSVSNGKHNKIAISVRVRASPLIKKIYYEMGIKKSRKN